MFSSARPADLAAVRALLERCQLPTADLRPAHLETFVVCHDGGEVVGAFGLELLVETALLRSLAVAPTHRGKRVGHLLWDKAHHLARDRGVRNLYLLTTTAAALFARWEFQVVSREDVPGAVRSTTEYSSLCPSTAVIMTSQLSQFPMEPG